MSQKVTLSKNQARSIAALLEHKTVTAAADAVSLSRKTIYSYLRDENFQRVLSDAKRSLMDAATVGLLAGQDKALKRLSEVIDSKDETNARLAAVAWLTFATRLKELEILDELEARVLALEKVRR